MRKELLELFGRRPNLALDPARLPGFLAEYLRLASRNTDCHPGLLATAWLPHIAVHIGNRVYMQANSARIYPNIWSCLLGPSSVSRKSTALKFAGYSLKPFEDELSQLKPDAYEAQTLLLQSVTAAKLLSCLAQNPCRIFVHHEISAWLADMNKNYNAGYKQTITELYDGVSKVVRTMERTEHIKDPALSIATATTEAWMYKNIRDTADQFGGFLQRFIYYVVRDVDLSHISLATREGDDLAELFAIYETPFKVFRDLPGPLQLKLSQEAIELRDSVYRGQYETWFATNNDNLMSYFTRVYDGYFYKFCAIFTLMWEWDELAKRLESGPGAVRAWFDGFRVSRETAAQSLYLCDFYFANTIPFLEIVSEQDRLAGERKLVDLLVSKYGGKAGHSSLLNSSHMRKREFNECIAGLIDREAITVDNYRTQQGNSGRLYVLSPDLLKSHLGGSQA